MTIPLLIMAFIATLLTTVLFEHYAIPFLRRFAKQPIYEGGPKWHLKKSGTPTMGGIGFALAMLLVVCLSLPLLTSKLEGKELLSITLCLVYALLNGAIGVIDDLAKLKKKENKGLTPLQKLALQFTVTLIFLILKELLLPTKAFGITILGIDLSVLILPLNLVITVYFVNCANLTDGIDGLATSVAFSISFVLLLYLSITKSPLTLLSASLMGACIGFLIFNINPAKIFMGDTGALFLGGIISSICIVSDGVIMLPIIGIVYLLEGISVILQIVVYKLTKKRLFKMAPLHHHLEKCGMSENGICICAMIITLLSSLFVFPLIKL